MYYKAAQYGIANFDKGGSMKQIMSFRLNPQTIATLNMLEKKLNLSKTAILEQALLLFASKELSEQHEILKYVGIINSIEADTLLNDIQSSRRNKEIKTDL